MKTFSNTSRNKKAQLLGSEVVLWMYRIILIGIVASSTVILVWRYGEVVLDKRPLMSGQILYAIANNESLLLKEIDKENIAIKYARFSFGNKMILEYCEQQRAGIEVKKDLYCEVFFIQDEKIGTIEIGIK